MTGENSKKPAISKPRTEPISVELGKKLKSMRHDANLSQQQLAHECELDRTYISLMERGLANPSLWTLGTVAHVLKASLPELFDGNKHTVAPSSHAGGEKRRKNQASHEPKVGERKRSRLR